MLLFQPQPRPLITRVVRVRLGQLLRVQRLAPKAQLQFAVTEFGAEPLAHRVPQEPAAEHGANAGAINKGLPKEARPTREVPQLEAPRPLAVCELVKGPGLPKRRIAVRRARPGLRRRLLL